MEDASQSEGNPRVVLAMFVFSVLAYGASRIFPTVWNSIYCLAQRTNSAECTPMLPYNDIFTRIKFVSDLAGAPEECRAKEQGQSENEQEGTPEPESEETGAA